MTRGSALRIVEEAPASTVAAPEPTSVAERRAARFVDAVARALADAQTNAGVGQAGVDVRLNLTDRPDRPLHLLLAKAPARITAEPQLGRPDVCVTLTSADLDCFLRDAEQLPLRILAGDIAFQGYVRKLLRVLPILRAGVERTSPQPEAG